MSKEKGERGFPHQDPPPSGIKEGKRLKIRTRKKEEGRDREEVEITDLTSHTASRSVLGVARNSN